MPTERPRHMITESDELSACLERAKLIWPEIADERSSLLKKVILEGITAVNIKASREKAAKTKAIKSLVDALTGVYPADWAESRKDEWPR